MKDHETRGLTNKNSNSVKQISSEDSEYVFNVTTNDSDGEMPCKIGGVVVSAVIDSGSKYNLLSQSVWEQMKSSKVTVTNWKCSQ